MMNQERLLYSSYVFVYSGSCYLNIQIHAGRSSTVQSQNAEVV